MLVINYNGNKPITDYFKFSVQGNNEADTIRFVLSLNQSGLVFNNQFNYYVKIQCELDDYYDKVAVPMDSINYDADNNLLTIDFILKAQQTLHKQIDVSLSCEKSAKNVVWQTQIVKINIPNGIPADEEIENKYPTALQELNDRVTALEEGGGGSGGGATDVFIEKIYLKRRSKKYPIIKEKYIADYDGEEYYCNDAEETFVCIKTTPINGQMLQEIKDGRFAIRFNYPVRGRKRGFTNHLTDGETKMNGVIFITEDNVFENAYGEKYIYYEESFLDFFQRFIKAYDYNNQEFSFEALNNGYSSILEALYYIMDDGIDDITHFSGVPTYLGEDSNYFQWGIGTTKLKGYKGSGYPYSANSDEVSLFQKSWADEKHNFWCPMISLITDTHNFQPFITSQFWRNKSGNGSNDWEISNFVGFSYAYNDINVGLLFSRRDSNRIRRFLKRVCLRPSCAIIDLNYNNLGEKQNCWLKTYPQSKQHINLGVGGYLRIIDNEFNKQYFTIIGRIMIGD